MTNLIDNALKYSLSDSGVNVKLESYNTGGASGFKVDVFNSPECVGWPDLNQVFKKYYRAEKSYRFTGSGLGLFLVFGLAQQMNAKLEYVPTESLIGFRLWLPL